VLDHAALGSTLSRALLWIQAEELMRERDLAELKAALLREEAVMTAGREQGGVVGTQPQLAVTVAGVGDTGEGNNSTLDSSSQVTSL
jgi:hypothetical protein